MLNSPTNWQVNLQIRANAGTGKTYALAVRYIQLLLMGISPSKILATTFTNKAAGEILQRIYSHLIKAIADADFAKELEGNLGVKFSKVEAYQILRELVAEQHLMQVGTLDSFFSKIARAFAWDLNLPNNWQLISDEMRSEIIVASIIDIMEADPALVEEVVSALKDADSSSNIKGTLLSVIEQVYKKLFYCSPQSWGNIELVPELRNSEWRELEERLANYQAPLTLGKKTPNKYWVNAIAKFRVAVSSRDVDELAGTSLFKNFLAGEKYSQHEIDSEMTWILRTIQRQIIATNRSKLKKRSERVAKFGSIFQQNYKTRLLKQGSLGFDEVKTHIAEAFITKDLDELYYRLDTKINHLLLDEFQDTALIEWLVLEPIADEVIAKPAESSFFCVGDVKQAIYAWRGGEAAIFSKLRERWPEALQEKSLGLSYRSHPLLMEYVNKLFNNIEQLPMFAAYEKVVSEWRNFYVNHQSACKAEPSAYVEFKSFPKAEASSTIDQCAQKIIEILEIFPTAKIGVLCRENKEVDHVIEILKSNRYNIPASEDASISLADSAPVVLLCLVLRLAYRPNNLLDAFILAQSKLGNALGITGKITTVEIQKIAGSIRKKLNIKGLYKYVSELSNFILTDLSSRERGQLNKFLSLARTYESAGNLNIEKFIEKVKATKLSDAASSNVQVMTIHKSKGLEFDAVFIPKFDFPLDKYNDKIVLKKDEVTGETVSVFVGVDTELKYVDPYFVNLEQQLKAKALFDSLSLVYVALTRAKRALYVFMQESAAKPDTVRAHHLIYNALQFNAGEKTEGNDRWFADHGKQMEASEAPIEQTAYIQSKLSKLQSRRKKFHYIRPSSHADEQELSVETFLSNKSAADFGTKVHELLEGIQWLTADEVQNYQQFVDKLSVEQSESLIVELKNCLNNAQEVLTKILDQRIFVENYGEVLSLYLEKPFAYISEDNLISGIIDRYITYKDSTGKLKAIIFDYKTDFIESAETLSKKCKLYEKQLEYYKQAVSKVEQIPLSDIEAQLVFIRAGKIV